MATELGLDLLGALYGMDDGGEIDQKSVTNGFDDRAVVFTDCVLDNLVVDLEQLQGMDFIAAHLAAETDHIGEHDRRKLTGFRLRRSTRFGTHEGDYAALSAGLSNHFCNSLNNCECYNLYSFFTFSPAICC
jgi:hypothetical protein